MKNVFSKSLLSWAAALIFSLLLIVNPARAQNKNGDAPINNGWTHLKYAIFFTHSDVEKLLADPAQFEKTMEYFAPVKPERVYLEGNSQGDINVELLKNITGRFKAMGIKVSGCMVPVSPHGGPSTYNNPEDLASLKKRMEALSEVFDNIILDDWLFTTATDVKSVKEKGNQSWADYRTKLILEQSKKYIIDPAKKINSKVKVIIKYPNWYEGHRQNGYDVYNETHLYDEMAVGIETRDPERQDQHIPIYSGYVFQKWFAGVEPKKWIGSWLDNYGMKGEADDYTAQVWQAVLAKSPEIILWCAGQLYPPNPSSDVYPHFRDMLPEFNRVAGMLHGDSRGVPIYLPYGSTGEYNIFGYLGMAGIPLTPVAKFPTDSQNAIFTLHSLQDSQLAEKMIKRLRNGHDVFMTWGLWKKLQNTEFKNTLSLVDYGGTVTSSEFRMREGWNEHIVKTDKPFTFPRIETTTWPYVRDVAVVKEDYDYGILLDAKYMNGTIYILNMPDNSYDLLQLPADALNMIRRAFNKELGVTLEGPGKVGLYLFGAKQYVLYNMGDREAPLTLRFDKKVPASGWQELVSGEQLKVIEDTTRVRFGEPVISNVSLTLRPFEIAVVQAP